MNETLPAAPLSHQRRPTESWYRDIWLQLYKFAYVRLQNREEAEDLAQETYSRVLARTGSPPSREYLFTTALNLIRDRWRRNQTRGVHMALDEKLLLQSEQQDDAVHRAWMEELMAQLPADYRQVLELRIVQGYSRSEVAKRMGKTELAVRGIQYRAVQMLREKIQEQMKEDAR